MWAGCSRVTSSNSSSKTQTNLRTDGDFGSKKHCARTLERDAFKTKCFAIRRVLGNVAAAGAPRPCESRGRFVTQTMCHVHHIVRGNLWQQVPEAKQVPTPKTERQRGRPQALLRSCSRVELLRALLHLHMQFVFPVFKYSNLLART